MPLTVPAHQAVVLPIKLRWPDRFDATALCVASALPDLTYPFVGNQGQTVFGGLLIVVPVTLVVCVLLRWRAAAGIFACVPDLGSFRVHSYSVITRRRPTMGTTLLSALIGMLSHVVLDSFTHGDRLLAQWLGLDTVLMTVPRIDDVDIALLLQLFGHVVGSLIGLWLFWIIGSRRLLEDWYGTEVVAAARRSGTTTGEKILFWSITIGVAGFFYLVIQPVGIRWVFKPMVGATVGALFAGSLIGRIPDRRVPLPQSG